MHKNLKNALLLGAVVALSGSVSASGVDESQLKRASSFSKLDMTKDWDVDADNWLPGEGFSANVADAHTENRNVLRAEAQKRYDWVKSQHDRIAANRTVVPGLIGMDSLTEDEIKGIVDAAKIPSKLEGVRAKQGGGYEVFGTTRTNKPAANDLSNDEAQQVIELVDSKNAGIKLAQKKYDLETKALEEMNARNKYFDDVLNKDDYADEQADSLGYNDKKKQAHLDALKAKGLIFKHSPSAMKKAYYDALKDLDKNFDIAQPVVATDLSAVPDVAAVTGPVTIESVKGLSLDNAISLISTVSDALDAEDDKYKQLVNRLTGLQNDLSKAKASSGGSSADAAALQAALARIAELEAAAKAGPTPPPLGSGQQGGQGSGQQGGGQGGDQQVGFTRSF